jgi:hypothetical protein
VHRQSSARPSPHSRALEARSSRIVTKEPRQNKELTPEVIGRLIKQKEAALLLGVSVRYLRDSNAPFIDLPGNGPLRKPLRRYDPVALRAWYLSFSKSALATAV